MKKTCLQQFCIWLGIFWQIAKYRPWARIYARWHPRRIRVFLLPADHRWSSRSACPMVQSVRVWACPRLRQAAVLLTLRQAAVRARVCSAVQAAGCRACSGTGLGIESSTGKNKNAIPFFSQVPDARRRGKVFRSRLTCFVKSAGFQMWMRFFSFAKSKIGNYWRWAVFLLGIYFWELSNHKICQVKFGKLLEMLWQPLASLIRLARTKR